MFKSLAKIIFIIIFINKLIAMSFTIGTHMICLYLDRLLEGGGGSDLNFFFNSSSKFTAIIFSNI
jgi:hypothetical protein